MSAWSYYQCDDCGETSEGVNGSTSSTILPLRDLWKGREYLVAANNLAYGIRLEGKFEPLLMFIEQHWPHRVKIECNGEFFEVE